jgi:hypothetical protein
VITELHAQPDTYPMTSRETLPLRFDVGGCVGPGETVSAPTATLRRLDTGASYPGGLAGSATPSGQYITQTVTGLIPNVTFRLSVQFQVATNKIFDVLLDIPCPD